LWQGNQNGGIKSLGPIKAGAQAKYYVGEDWIANGSYGHREQSFTISAFTNVLLLFGSVNLMVDAPNGASIFTVGLRWNGTVVTSTIVNTLGSPVGYTFFTYPLFAAVSNVAAGTYEFRYDLTVSAGSQVRTHLWTFNVVGIF
jgi:hypothetical protein